MAGIGCITVTCAGNGRHNSAVLMSLCFDNGDILFITASYTVVGLRAVLSAGAGALSGFDSDNNEKRHRRSTVMPFPLAIIACDRLDDLAACFTPLEAKQPSDEFDQQPNQQYKDKQNSQGFNCEAREGILIAE